MKYYEGLQQAMPLRSQKKQYQQQPSGADLGWEPGVPVDPDLTQYRVLPGVPWEEYVVEEPALYRGTPGIGGGLW